MGLGYYRLGLPCVYPRSETILQCVGLGMRGLQSLGIQDLGFGELIRV